MTGSQPPDRWVRLAAGYQSDPRILAAGNAGELMWVRALAISRQTHTDGHVNHEHLAQLSRGFDRNRGPAIAGRLVTVGLWEPCDDGWRIPYERWSRWQVTESELVEQRAAATARQARWRARRNGDT
jgi:hypothetical protein